MPKWTEEQTQAIYKKGKTKWQYSNVKCAEARLNLIKAIL